MKTRLKLAVLFVLSVVSAGLVVGCGGSSGSSETTSANGAVDGGGGSFVYNAAGASTQFEQALQSSFLKTFDEKYNFDTTVDPFCCGIEKLEAAVNSGNVPWSSVEWVSSAEFRLAKEAELLEPLDTKVVPVDLLQPGTYDKYGYQVYTGAINLGWSADAYPAGEPHPTKLADLMDTEKFPGKRCLYKGIQGGGTFEAALLSAGVPPDELYPLDLDLAFEKLDEIKDDIVWWETGAQSAQDLLDGTCKLGIIWNGVAQSTSNEGNPVEVTWDQAVTVYGMNTVPKGSPNPEAAQHLLGLMLTDQAAQVEFLGHTAYTTPLKTPVPLPPEIAKWAPQGENLTNTIAEDANYYFENNAEITQRFNEWLVTG